MGIWPRYRDDAPRRCVAALRPRRLGAAGCLALMALGTVGCERPVDPHYVSAAAVKDLDPPLQQALREHLEKATGTPAKPKLLGGDDKQLEHLKLGAQVYRRNCEQCHGVSGDGNGQAAEYLTPRPRDYRRGIFKFTSTAYGSKPLRDDILRTVTRGITGTSMPSFRRLPKRELEAVVDYVLALTHRGELETLLIDQAQNEGEITDEAATDLANIVLQQWKSAEENVVEPLSKMPPISAETIAAGAAAFQKRECFKCHGRDGRGGLAGGIEVGVDAWGRKAAAADLTSGMLHGGQLPLDVYRRIHAGINGTPMPAFKDAFASEPDTIWHLAHYVLHLANERRRGVQFPPTKPAPTAHAQASPAAAEQAAAASQDEPSTPATDQPSRTEEERP